MCSYNGLEFEKKYEWEDTIFIYPYSMTNQNEM